MRRSLREHAAAVKHNHGIAERQDFGPAVCDVQNGDAVRLVPPPEVIHNARFHGGVQTHQGFIKQQHFRVGDQGTSQGNSLPLPT